MKNAYKLLGFIAMIAVIGLALSCEQEAKPGVSTLSAPSIKDAPAFPAGTTFATRAEAESMINSIGIPWSVKNAYDDAFEKAYTSDKLNTSTKGYSASLSFKDVTSSDVSGLKINGKASGSVSFSGLTLAEFLANRAGGNGYESWSGLAKDKQSKTEKYSATITFSMPEMVDNVGGVVKVDGKTEQTHTLLNAGNKVAGWKNNNVTKYSFALTVVSNGKAAKFRFSSAESNTHNPRKADGKNFTETSNIEVYDGDNKLQYTFNNRIWNFSYVDNIIAGKWGFKLY